jgi:hypothetical protein
MVVTPNCGAPVRDGHEAIVVPIRDSRAIARALEHLALNRQVADNMSAAAIASATRYTTAAYSDRLLGALRLKSVKCS